MVYGVLMHLIIYNTIISSIVLQGYIGIVKDATDTTARVELHAYCKTITVDRSRLINVGLVPISWYRLTSLASTL